MLGGVKYYSEDINTECGVSNILLNIVNVTANNK
jgi:hypothetical protein